MAFWIDPNNVIFLHNDDKLAFPAWIDESAERTQNWEQAVVEHKAWVIANPGLANDQAKGAAASIFQEWIEYANAVVVTPPTPPNTP